MKNYLYELKYFQRGDSISGSDFQKERQIEFINLQSISSISSVREFRTPLTDTLMGYAAMVIMQNDDTFFIDSSVHAELLSNFTIVNI